MTELEKKLDMEYDRTLDDLSQTHEEEETDRLLKKLDVLHKHRMDRDSARNGKMDRILKTTYDWGSLGLQLGVTCFWMAEALTFENTGTFLSRAVTWVNGHMRLFKK